MKKLMSIACAGIVLLSVGLTAGPASAESVVAPPMAATEVTNSVPGSVPASVLMPMTGNYEYNCVLSNGSSYFMAPGEALTNCHGSYLQKYLDGRQLSSISLTYGGVVATNPPVGWVWGTGCILSVASGVALVVFPPSGAIAWWVTGSLTGMGIVSSCVTI